MRLEPSHPQMVTVESRCPTAIHRPQADTSIDAPSMDGTKVTTSEDEMEPGWR